MHGRQVSNSGTQRYLVSFEALYFNKTYFAMGLLGPFLVSPYVVLLVANIEIIEAHVRKHTLAKEALKFGFGL